MGVSPAVFQSAGQRTEHYLPGSYARSEAQGDAGDGLSAGNGVIIGGSSMGAPATLYTFFTVNVSWPAYYAAAPPTTTGSRLSAL